MLSIVKSFSEKESQPLAPEGAIGGSWINAVAPSREELETISKITGVQRDLLVAALDVEETSRIEVEDNAILVVINTPKACGNFNYDAIPLGVVITADYIVTVCLEENDILPRKPGNINGFCSYKRTRFLFQILFKTATLFLKHLTQISRQSDQIERNLRMSMKNEELFQLLDLEKGLTYFTAALRANRAVVDKLIRLCSNSQMHELIRVREEDEDLLEDVKIEYDQAFEMVQMYSNILSGMMDAFASIISNNLNIVMKFLASMTILLAIPTAVSSFFGMNVPVPFTGHPMGFTFVTGLSLVLACGAAYFLWRKRML
jgi:magnesium transporter